MKVKRELKNVEEYGKYYQHTTYCGNCGERNNCYVEKGNKLDGLFITCCKCECEISLVSRTRLYS